MTYPQIDGAHGELVNAVNTLTKTGFSLIPATLVSVRDTNQGQLVVFDGLK